MKEFLKKLIATKEARAAEIKELITASQDINEVRSLGAEQEKVNAELLEARSQLALAEEKEERGQKLDTVAMYGTATATRSNENPRATMEYRSAFMNYVQKGVSNNILVRANAENVSTDLGVLLPETIIQEIIKGVQKVYGQLYSKVRKTNIKGGVKYPVGSFSANLVWGGTAGTDKEHGVSETQNAGKVESYVQFSYNIGEIRIAQSLLQSVLTVEVFEREIVNALVEAYVKAMDIAILEGTGTNQPTGIFADTSDGIQKIADDHIITFTADEMADWTKWQEKFFGVLPLSMRAQPYEFVMTPNTFESNLSTLKDTTNQPISREVWNPASGDLTATFKGKNVTFIEEGSVVKNFNDALNDEYFGFAWVPNQAYAINTNMEFGYKRYFDENTNQYITKGLVIVDGKILDPKYIYLLKKVVSA